jgi:hypothetical protein
MTTKMAAVFEVDSPSPVAFMNVFDEGDVWLKFKDCSGCGEENQITCCGDCPFRLEAGCYVHIKIKGQKPFECCVQPAPHKTYSYCQLEFVCIEGPRKGTVRKMSEPIPWQV